MNAPNASELLGSLSLSVKEYGGSAGQAQRRCVDTVMMALSSQKLTIRKAGSRRSRGSPVRVRMVCIVGAKCDRAMKFLWFQVVYCVESQ